MIGVLTLGLFTTLNPIDQLKKGWDGQRKSDLAQIQKALETYYQDNGRYPLNATSCQYSIQGNNDNNDCIEWGLSWLPYMAKVPQDPNPSKKYIYFATVGGQSYYLYASLDRGVKDLQVCNGGNACTNVPSGVTCGGASAVCNYGVSSSNVSP